LRHIAGGKALVAPALGQLEHRDLPRPEQHPPAFIEQDARQFLDRNAVPLAASARLTVEFGCERRSVPR
jgi:hypothetical protein